MYLCDTKDALASVATKKYSTYRIKARPFGAARLESLISRAREKLQKKRKQPQSAEGLNLLLSHSLGTGKGRERERNGGRLQSAHI